MTLLSGTTMRGRRLIAIAATMATTAILVSGCTVRAATEDSPDETAAANAFTEDCENYNPTQGVTDDSILIGTSLPLTGANSAGGVIQNGIRAYFETVNADGGIDGRKLELVVRDDGYDPSKTATNVNELLNQEGVFAFLSILGTANVLAVQPALQSACVPNLLVASGAPQVTGDTASWTIPGLPNYTQDVDALAASLVSSGVKTVSTLTMNGDFGNEYLTGLTAALEGTDVEIIDGASFDFPAPDVTTQVTQLASSGADAVLVAAVGTKCAQILNGIDQSGWEPDIYIDQLCTNQSLMSLLEGNAGDGMVCTAWYKTPTSSRFADDPGLGAYFDAMEKYEPSANADEEFAVNGWLWAQIFVEILRSADNLDRGAVMAAARDVDVHVDTLIDGINYRLDADHLIPITGLQLQKFDAASDVFSFIDPETGEALAPGETLLTEAD